MHGGDPPCACSCAVILAVIPPAARKAAYKGGKPVMQTHKVKVHISSQLTVPAVLHGKLGQKPWHDLLYSKICALLF